MNRLSTILASGKKNLLSIYFTAGYPALEDTAEIALALAEAGADFIELGMPYSDPLADGTTIQDSSQQAIANGMTMDLLFRQVEDIRRRTDIPLVWMGYLNPVMQYGEERFLQRCAATGIDGLIIPDLPLHEYEANFQPLARQYGLLFNFLITPQTPEPRIREIERLSEGFIYMVSSAAVTGAQAGISAEQIGYFERIGAMGLRRPRLIGFGISDKDTFLTACRYADGAIIGSAFIRALSKGSTPAAAAKSFVETVVS
ncbi:MAG: tryptophan synthase subunit alpha [Saprospiraceae bacterium]|nr:tryptophan synthase subunit alpha [Saprospiraceae bacterium]